MKLRKSQKKLDERVAWYEANVDKATGKAKPGKGYDAPVSVYHKPGSNKK